jgi:hypothetical protein
MNNEKAEILHKNYGILELERGEIEAMIREYETLNSAYENGNENVSSNYYLYIIYLLIAILLVFAFLRISVSSIQTGGGHMKVSPLLLVFLATVIIFNAYINK